MEKISTKDKKVIKELKFKDTIPDLLKERILFGKEMPSLHGYSAIGFMADHCLVKYNMDEWIRLVVQIYLDELHEKHKYPKEVTEFDFDRNIGICLNNCIWDMEKGIILKLSEDKKVVHAVEGFEVLNEEEIE